MFACIHASKNDLMLVSCQTVVIFRVKNFIYIQNILLRKNSQEEDFHSFLMLENAWLLLGLWVRGNVRGYGWGLGVRVRVTVRG